MLSVRIPIPTHKTFILAKDSEDPNEYAHEIPSKEALMQAMHWKRIDKNHLELLFYIFTRSGTDYIRLFQVKRTGYFHPDYLYEGDGFYESIQGECAFLENVMVRVAEEMISLLRL